MPRASPKAQAASAPKPSTASAAELAAAPAKAAPAPVAPAKAAAAAAPATAADGAAHVGKSVRVYWTADKAWYEGSVTEFNGCQHLVVYEDGDEEWLELEAEKFEFVDAKPAGANKGARCMGWEFEFMEGKPAGARVALCTWLNVVYQSFRGAVM